MTPQLLLLAGGLALLTLIPTRRLFVAGWPTGVLRGYFLIVWLASVLAALAPGSLRLLLALLVIAWVVPFVTPRAGLDRLFHRTEGRQPPRNVTPGDG